MLAGYDPSSQEPYNTANESTHMFFVRVRQGAAAHTQTLRAVDEQTMECNQTFFPGAHLSAYVGFDPFPPLCLPILPPHRLLFGATQDPGR